MKRYDAYQKATVSIHAPVRVRRFNAVKNILNAPFQSTHP